MYSVQRPFKSLNLETRIPLICELFVHVYLIIFVDGIHSIPPLWLIVQLITVKIDFEKLSGFQTYGTLLCHQSLCKCDLILPSCIFGRQDDTAHCMRPHSNRPGISDGSLPPGGNFRWIMDHGRLGWCHKRPRIKTGNQDPRTMESLSRVGATDGGPIWVTECGRAWGMTSRSRCTYCTDVQYLLVIDSLPNSQISPAQR